MRLRTTLLCSGSKRPTTALDSHCHLGCVIRAFKRRTHLINHMVNCMVKPNHKITITINHVVNYMIKPTTIVLILLTIWLSVTLITIFILPLTILLMVWLS